MGSPPPVNLSLPGLHLPIHLGRPVFYMENMSYSNSPISPHISPPTYLHYPTTREIPHIASTRKVIVKYLPCNPSSTRQNDPSSEPLDLLYSPFQRLHTVSLASSRDITSDGSVFSFLARNAKFLIKKSGSRSPLQKFIRHTTHTALCTALL